MPSSRLGDLGRREQLAAQVQDHAGQRIAQCGRELGKQRVRRRAGEAHREASELAARRPARVLGRAVDGRQDLTRPPQKHLAGRRELDPAGRAVQQCHAELGLQPSDLLRKRRLGDVQALGGAAEVALLGDGDEVAEMA